MPVIQNTFGQQIFSQLPGQLMGAYEDKQSSARFARGLLRAGVGAFRVEGFGHAGSRNSIDPGECFQIPSIGTGASASAIGSAVSSAAGTKTIGSGVTAGTVGSSELQPARKLTVTFDASTDWDPTTAVITYVNHLGQTVSENLAVATSTVATTVGYAKKFVSLVIPAQTGSAGAATIGVAAMTALTIADFLGVVIRNPVKTMVNPSNLYIGPTSDGITNANTLAHYVDGDTVPLLQVGRIVLFTETAVSAGDQVYVRIAANGSNTLLGAFRNTADSGNALLVTGARFVRNEVAGAAEAKLHGGW